MELSLNSLTKKYDTLTAVKDLNLARIVLDDDECELTEAANTRNTARYANVFVGIRIIVL